jgi:Fic family protein
LENGRTGRVLNLLFLQQHNLLHYPVLSLSEYILQNKIEYYHLYQQVREQGEWTSWILFLLRGLESVVRKISNQLLATESLYKATTELCRTNAKSIYTKPLMDLIFRRPYCKIEYLQEFNIAHRKAAGKYLHVLKELGILQVKKIGKENIFIHQALMNLLQF